MTMTCIDLSDSAQLPSHFVITSLRFTSSFQVKTLLDEILEKLPEEFNILELLSKVEDRTPYIVVAFQECERMNILTKELRRSLKELDLGLKVTEN